MHHLTLTSYLLQGSLVEIWYMIPSSSCFRIKLFFANHYFWAFVVLRTKDNQNQVQQILIRLLSVIWLISSMRKNVKNKQAWVLNKLDIFSPIRRDLVFESSFSHSKKNWKSQPLSKYLSFYVQRITKNRCNKFGSLLNCCN